MELSNDDAQVIAAYIRIAQPDYKGPVCLDLHRLAAIHQAKVQLVTKAALIKMRLSVTSNQ